MKDWVFPSVAFVIFLYAMGFIAFHIHNYQSANISSFQQSQESTKTDDINTFLQEISRTFR